MTLPLIYLLEASGRPLRLMNCISSGVSSPNFSVLVFSQPLLLVPVPEMPPKASVNQPFTVLIETCCSPICVMSSSV